ncbi:MAG: hypothetical protein ACYTF0_06595, partial [Planctomycetota bacterium]
TEDPAASFGHLMLVPGGGHVEQDAMLEHSSHYFDADQLFHTAVDPFEVANVASDPANAERLADLKARLRAHLQHMGDGFPLD